MNEADAVDVAEDEMFGDRGENQLPAQWSGGQDRRARIRAALDELDGLKARDYTSQMAQRAQREAKLGQKLRGPKPLEQSVYRAKPRRANTTDPHSRIIPHSGRGVMQGYNAQAAATASQVVVAAQVVTGSNDQPYLFLWPPQSPKISVTQGIEAR